MFSCHWDFLYITYSHFSEGRDYINKRYVYLIIILLNQHLKVEKKKWFGNSATRLILMAMKPGPWFNIKMTSYQYRKSHCEDKTILWLARWHFYTESGPRIFQENSKKQRSTLWLLMPWLLCHQVNSSNGIVGLILGLRPANERRRYFVTTSLIGWAQTLLDKWVLVFYKGF